MTSLHMLQDTLRPNKRKMRVGRGPGCGKGKTCGRGEKGAGSRSGYKRRLGYEGGQMRLHMKLPNRGFSNVRFQKRYHTVNLGQIDKMYKDGECVDLNSLRERGFVSGNVHGIKVLGNGQLTKKVSFVVDALSDSAREKLEKAGLSFELKKAK